MKVSASAVVTLLEAFLLEGCVVRFPLGNQVIALNKNKGCAIMLKMSTLPLSFLYCYRSHSHGRCVVRN